MLTEQTTEFLLVPPSPWRLVSSSFNGILVSNGFALDKSNDDSASFISHKRKFDHCCSINYAHYESVRRPFGTFHENQDPPYNTPEYETNMKSGCIINKI